MNTKAENTAVKQNEDWVRKLVEIVERLRAPGGCPWDREQTHQTLKNYLIEECAELLDAVDDNDMTGVCEELGDILMHIIMSSTIAKEKGEFTFDDVARVSAEKMLRRHPHVFGTEHAEDSSKVLEIWEKVKKEEKKGKVQSVVDGIPRHFPALLQATKLQKKVAKFGFDWSSETQIVEKIEEELGELKDALRKGDESEINEEIGDLLFAVVNLSRFRNKLTAEDLLAAAVKKFQIRFRYIESKLAELGKSPAASNLEEMEKFWQEAKKNGLK